MLTDVEIYVPGAWICRTCQGRFSERNQVFLFTTFGPICPNDGAFMRRETYRDALVLLTEMSSRLMAECAGLAEMLAVIFCALHDMAIQYNAIDCMYLAVREIALRILEENNYQFLPQVKARVALPEDK